MFGIAPSLKIIGQNVTDNTRQEVANAIRKIEPAIDVEVEYVELPDKPDNYVIAIYFDSNNFKNGPYSFDGRAFYKVESTTALMPRQMYEERLKISNPQRFSWENTPNSEITVDDIDTELLYQTLHDGIGSRRIHASAMTLQDPMKIMLKLGVARKDGMMTWQDFVNDHIGSLPANPTIANVFYRHGAMEAWGRGIGLIMGSCREQALPAPEIKVVPPFVNLTIWFKHPLTEGVKASAPQVEDSYTPSHTPSDDDFTSSHNDTHNRSNIITPQDKVFEFCKSPKSIVEIAAMLGVNDRRWVRKKYIAPYIGTKLQMTISR